MADSTVVVRTEKPNQSPSNGSSTGSSKGVNVLHKYRSVNYLFTLAALRRDDAHNPNAYRDSTLDFVILKSGGKGDAGISKNVKPVQREVTVPTPPVTSDQQSAAASKKTSTVTTSTTLKVDDYSGQGLVAGFNENSPGRFDMFIDNIEIETLMATNEGAGMTQPTTLSFDVTEPYSINGFIEALHVASIAAGYPTYTNAVFLLKLEFFGYPDGPGLPDPQVEKNAIRYFPITLTSIDVSIDEKGTKYQVKAIGSNERGFGNPSQIKKPIQMTGSTVGEILSSLMTNMTKQTIEGEKDSKQKIGANQYDEYRIKFPKWVEDAGWSNGTTVVNDISNAKVSELLKDNTLYKFPDNGEETKPTANKPKDQKTPTPEQNAKQPEAYKLNPQNPVVQFPEGKNIQECISAIIRDSHFVRDIVRKLNSESEWKQVVKDNMVDYFLVKLEVENKSTTDEEKKRPYQIFTYVVTPFKILYTRIPGYAGQQVDMTVLNKMVLREYNYIYMGKNLDVINFKLNFNTLFFEALPQGLGNTSSPPSRDGAARDAKVEVKTSPDNLQSAKQRELPSAPTQSSPDLTNVQRDNGGQPQKDAYYNMAKSMHSAITDSKGSMLTGELDILGDPYYLVTGGIGNYNPTPSKNSNRETADGEAAHTYGEVLININFRNPIDINPLEKGGGMFFDPKLIPFSGVYRVTKAKSTFKNGDFKQALDIIRQPGQSMPQEVPSNEGENEPSDPTLRFSQRPNPKDAPTKDSTPADLENPGQRPSEMNLYAQQMRGLPSPGLPGQLSNFTNATGGLGGTISVVSNVSGATPNLAGATRLASQIYGGVVPGGQYQPAFGMPLPAKAAVGLQQRVYSPGGYVQQLGNNLANSFGVTGAPKQLLDQFLGIAASRVNKATALGSGIGAGAILQITKNNPSPTSAYDYISQPQASVPTALPLTGIATGLNSNSLAAAANMPDGGAGIMNNIGTNIRAATQGSKPDPLAIAGQFGIDQSQLSGLSPNLQSKVISQLTNLSNATPPNTDLGVAAAQGINLNGLGPSGIANLPPTAPYATAPAAAPDIGFLNSITAKGGPSALARSYGVNSVNEIPQDQLPADVAQSAISQSPSVAQTYLSKLGINNSTDLVTAGLKLYAERKQLMGPTGIPGSLEGNFIGVRNQLGPVNIVGDLGSSVVNKFGSKSSGTSPLDKIMIR